jgi:hypothetical protein
MTSARRVVRRFLASSSLRDQIINSARRVAARWLEALRIEQRRGELPTSFWRTVVLRLCETLDVDPRGLKIQFRKRNKRLMETGAPGLEMLGYIIILDPQQHLRTQMGTLAHELRHIHQTRKKMLSQGRNEDGVYGQMWKGEWYPDDTPYTQMPWEIDAARYNAVGEALYREMKAKGEMPLTKSELAQQKLPFIGPTMGDMDDVLSDEEWDEERTHRRRDFDGWVERWRERYKSGWRGLKVSPAVGRVG